MIYAILQDYQCPTASRRPFLHQNMHICWRTAMKILVWKPFLICTTYCIELSVPGCESIHIAISLISPWDGPIKVPAVSKDILWSIFIPAVYSAFCILYRGTVIRVRRNPINTLCKSSRYLLLIIYLPKSWIANLVQMSIPPLVTIRRNIRLENLRSPNLLLPNSP